MTYDYNEVSKVYDDVRKADFEVVKFIIEKAQINEGSKVLEIGCGTANYLSLINQLTQAKVWGVDRSRGMLNKAKKKCSNAIFIEDDAVKLMKIPDKTFNVVYMVDVVHHIKDIHTMLLNIKRILMDNGILIIFSDSHEHIKNRLTTKYFPETLEPELKRYQDTPELIGSLSEASYKQIESGSLEIEDDESYGIKLVDIASEKGFSMFGLISDKAISEGIKRIREDLVKGPVVYHRGAPYVMARNQ